MVLESYVVYRIEYFNLNVEAIGALRDALRR